MYIFISNINTDSLKYEINKYVNIIVGNIHLYEIILDPFDIYTI